MIDLRDRADLRGLAHSVRAIRRATGDQPCFIAGAQARDLLITHAHGIPTGRATQDVDFAVMIEDWSHFQQLRQNLIASGEFAAVRGPVHRLFFGSIPIDLIPFGAIEGPDRKIAWPPAGDEVMTTLGFREALDQCESVRLPDAVDALVASIPAQTVLKLIAWQDMRAQRRAKDAQDLRTLMTAYGRIELDRIASEREVMVRRDFDVDAAGAWLLGSDVANAFSEHAQHASPLLSAVQATIARETDPAGRLTLVSSMGGHSVDDNLKLATWFREGIAARLPNTVK